MASISMELQESARWSNTTTTAATEQNDGTLEGDEETVEESSEDENPKVSSDDKEITLDGSFFGRMGIPYAAFALVYIIFRLSTLLAGYSWSRNTAAEMLDVKEPKEVPQPDETILNIHAYLGMFLIGAIAVQYLSASYFSSKREELMRWLHRVSGRILVTLWPVCILIGGIFSFSRALSPSAVTEDITATAVGIVTGVFSMANLVVGYLAIAHRPMGQRDYFLHKACMFFSMHYAIGFTASILAVTAIQLFFWDNCFIGSQGYAVGLATGFLLQTMFLVICMHFYDRRYFQKKVVRINLYMLAVHHSMFLFFVIAAFLVMPPEEGHCF